MTYKNIFDQVNSYIRDTESSLVNLLSAIAPWGAPLAPAYMSYGGMTKHLGFTPFVAGVIAGVIEILGLATVHTTLLFWQHNRRYKMEYKKQPTALAAGMFGLYLVIILGVNVVLEAYSQELITWAWTPILARAMLSLLAVPAAVTMAIRTQHTELLHQLQAGKENRAGVPPAQEFMPVVPDGAPVAQRGTYDRFVAAQAARNGKGPMSLAEVVTQFKIPKRTAYRWLDKYKKLNTPS
jgi:hypothetical protein